MSEQKTEFADMRPVPVRPQRQVEAPIGERILPVRDGRFGVQQFATIRGVDVWTFATVNCGYERIEDAMASIAGLNNYRVADRTTGRPVEDCQRGEPS